MLIKTVIAPFVFSDSLALSASIPLFFVQKYPLESILGPKQNDPSATPIRSKHSKGKLSKLSKLGKLGNRQAKQAEQAEQSEHAGQARQAKQARQAE